MLTQAKWIIVRASLFFVVTVVLSSSVFGEHVNSDDAKEIATQWLTANPLPFEYNLADVIGDIETVTDDGDALFYIVNLIPEGYLVIPENDRFGNVVAFSDNGYFTYSNENPLFTILKNDIVYLQQTAEMIPVPAKESVPQSLILGAGSVTDLRVSPFVESRWNQSDVTGMPCYNYYTPNNYVTGCVATVMAQVMRYHQHPNLGIGQTSYNVTVNGASETKWTRGGNGAGGPYNWAEMVLDPANEGVDASERQAIGALLYDAGISVNMGYTSNESSAIANKIAGQFTSLFGYSNSITGYNNNNNIPTSDLIKMINPCLDGGKPVILGISRVGGGHAVVADGYGYIGNTMYHHLNLGWGGSNDAWYALPIIDTSASTYTSVDSCIYNTFVSQSNEVISGRVLDLSGNPISGVTVQAKYNGSIQATTTSNNKGVYALIGVASNRAYTINATKSPYLFNTAFATTTTSQDSTKNCGNVWGVNLTATNAGAPNAFDQSIDAVSGDMVVVTLLATDEGLPNPPGSLTYLITALPEHGRLIDPNDGTIFAVPYLLPGNVVHYQACEAYSGDDTFYFVANDGGSGAGGGDSLPAEVAITVDNTFVVTYNPTSNYIDHYYLNTTTKATRYQIIYYPDEIIGDVDGTRDLTSIAIEVYNAYPINLANFTIRLKHTTRNAYPSFVDYENSGWSTVYQANQSLPAGWQTFQFSVPFAYNGVDNLMIDLSYENSAISGSTGACKIKLAGENRAIGINSDIVPNPLTWSFYTIGTYSITNAHLYMKFGQGISGQVITGDCNIDCQVTSGDLKAISKAWLSSTGDANFDAACDQVADGIINMLDVGVVADHWQQTSFD